MLISLDTSSGIWAGGADNGDVDARLLEREVLGPEGMTFRPAYTQCRSDVIQFEQFGRFSSH